MTELANHPVSKRTKLLLTGDSGAGKTGSLASLANAGFNLRIIDLDNKLAIMFSYIEQAAIKNVHYVTVGSRENRAYQVVNNLCKKWVNADEDLGELKDWTHDDILVIDSLSFLGEACMRAALSDDNRYTPDDVKFDQTIYAIAQGYLVGLIARICDDNIPCSIVVCTHIDTKEDEMGIMKQYPASGVGRALHSRIGRYFDNVWRIDTKADGTHVLRTQGDHKMSLSCSAPHVIEKQTTLDLGKHFKVIMDHASNLQKGS